MNYQKFLQSKSHPDDLFGFDPVWLSPKLFPFQKALLEWAIKKGRSALFEGCGLGKSFQELVIAENIVHHTNKPVLLLTPLAVSPQMIREGEKFDIECKQTRGKVYKGINVTNYEKLKHFNPSDFSGVICDESGCLKNFDGKRRKEITEFVTKVKYRLLATATPAPNDYMELGTSSEALGAMPRGQMLGMFFSNGGESTQQWELKGHARKRFWQWMCTWARAVQKPSDLGFVDDGFILPKLTVRQHVVISKRAKTGFGLVGAVTLEEQREERNLTIVERCEKVAEILPKDDYAIVYCHLNPEGDLLEKMIPGAVQVAGKHYDEQKEDRLSDFALGKIKILITKPKIAGFGLNFQHCNRVVTFPSHSFEMWYQSIRRCWRFGQKRPVSADIVTSEGESRVMKNMQRKERQAEIMFEELVRNMHTYQMRERDDNSVQNMEVPSWL